MSGFFRDVKETSDSHEANTHQVPANEKATDEVKKHVDQEGEKVGKEEEKQLHRDDFSPERDNDYFAKEGADELYEKPEKHVATESASQESAASDEKPADEKPADEKSADEKSADKKSADENQIAKDSAAF